MITRSIETSYKLNQLSTDEKHTSYDTQSGNRKEKTVNTAKGETDLRTHPLRRDEIRSIVFLRLRRAKTGRIDPRTNLNFNRVIRSCVVGFKSRER